MAAVKEEQKYVHKLEHEYNSKLYISWIKLTMLK